MEQYAEVNQKNQKNFYKNVFICSFIFTDCITFFKTNRNEYKNKFICTVNRKKCFQIL